MDIKVSKHSPKSSPNNPKPPNANVASICGDGDEMTSALKFEKRKEKRKLRRQERKRGIYNLSFWHAHRLRILQDERDFASFEQYIKWKGGSVPEYHDDIEYLNELTEEFDRLDGYAFFEEHGLDLPPIGIGGYESTFFN